MKKHMVVIALAVGVLLAVVFLAFHLHQKTKEKVLSQYNEHQLLVARLTARQIESYFHACSHDVRYLSSLTSLRHLDVKTISTDVQKNIGHLKTVHIDGILVLDEKGKVVYSTAGDAIGSNYARSDIYTWAKNPANKGMVRLTIVKSDKQGTPATGEALKPPSPRPSLVTPLYQESIAGGSPGPGGKFSGILLLTVDLGKMMAERTLLSRPVKNTLWIWVMDEDGTVLLQSEHPSMAIRNIRGKTPECNRCHVSFDYAEKMVAVREGTEEYQIKGYPKKLAAFTTMTFEDTSWIIVANAPYDEVTGFIRENFKDTLRLLSVVVLAMGFASYFLYGSYRQRMVIEEEVKHLKERQGLMEELRETRDYLENLIGYANAPIIVWDPQFRITRFNRAFERLTGYTAGEVVGQELRMLFPEGSREESFSRIERTLGGEYWESVEIPILRKDGEVRIALWNSANLCTGDGATVIATIAQGQDITERKQAEEALRDAHQRLSFHVQRMPLGYIVWNKEFRVTEWNPAAERIFGWTTKEVQGKHPYEFIVPIEAKPHVDKVWSKLLEGDETSYSLNANTNKDGRIITCEWFNTPLRDASGGIVGVLSMVHDVTEKTQLERQLQTSQRMEAIGTLAGGIAHDFNNSLTGIFGFGEMLRLQLAGNERAISDLNEVQRCAERAAKLTRQLLTYARRQIIEPINLSLNTVITDLLKLVSKVVGEHIEIRTFLATDLPTIRADVGQMEQVVMNLILNARDAIPGGGQILLETGTANLDAEYVRYHPYMQVGSYVLFTVSDTGIGMDEKIQERVFEPFFTTKSPDKGSGLGLAMVYGIVKQHNGFIHLYSEPGKGTTFKIYLPPVEAAPDVVISTKQPGILGGTETILLAEDDESVRMLVEGTLKELGYTVLAARNGEEAVAIFNQNGETISLALLDVVMPVKGGKEAYEVMHRARPDLKVIFMSGYTANAVHESFVLVAGIPFLAKPFGPGALARKVREVLDAQV